MNKQEIIEKLNALDYEIQLASNDSTKFEKDLFVGVTNRLEQLRNAIQSLTTEPQVDKVSVEEYEYEFERYENLTEYIQEMANTGRVPREWSSFLFCLNTILSQLRQSNAEANKGEYSIEKQHDGTYKLYLGRNDQQHGLWICSLSEFDINKEATIKAILNGLNNAEAMREHAIGFYKNASDNNLQTKDYINWLYNEYLTTLTK